jgi:signal transduction histidine kinase
MIQPPRPSFIRAIARAFVRGYIRFGRTAWWRIFLGLLIIFVTLITFIVYPTHHSYISNAKNGPEREALKRVVKRAALSETQRIGIRAANVVVDENQEAGPEAPEPAEPPEPPEPPTKPETWSSSRSGSSISIDKRGIKIELDAVDEAKIAAEVESRVARALAKSEADAARVEANAEKRATEAQAGKNAGKPETGEWHVKVWGLTFTENDWDHTSNLVPRESQLNAGLQTAVEAAARFDVRKAIYGAFALIAFTLLSLVMLIVRGFAGRSARQTQRVKVVEAAAKVDNSARLIAEAQLKAMQAQVEPHFLFNTLAHVKALQEIDVAQAGNMLDHLITYLRTALPNLREGSSTLGKEFDLAQSYLNILKLRMGDRLSFSLDLPESLKNQIFPPALIINLVENAIKHGVERARGGGSIRLNAQRVGDLISVTVSDTGRGLDPNGPTGTGVGLSSIRNRMKLLYGEAATLNLEPNTPSGVVATLTLPAVVPDSVPQASSAHTTVTPNANVSECKINAALLIGLVGGIVGAHNWYLRRKRYAVMQGILGTIALTSSLDGDPVVFAFMVVGAWLAADLVLIATKSMKDGSGKLVTIEK